MSLLPPDFEPSVLLTRTTCCHHLPTKSKQSRVHDWSPGRLHPSALLRPVRLCGGMPAASRGGAGQSQRKTTQVQKGAKSRQQYRAQVTQFRELSEVMAARVKKTCTFFQIQCNVLARLHHLPFSVYRLVIPLPLLREIVPRTFFHSLGVVSPFLLGFLRYYRIMTHKRNPGKFCNMWLAVEGSYCFRPTGLLFSWRWKYKYV